MDSWLGASLAFFTPYYTVAELYSGVCVCVYIYIPSVVYVIPLIYRYTYYAVCCGESHISL